MSESGTDENSKIARRRWSVGDVFVMAPVAAGLVWCLVVGVRIWTAPPARGSGVQFSAEIRSDSTGVTTGTVVIEPVEDRSFSDVSTLGIVPLLIPVLLAGWALWAAWRRRILGLAVATLVFLFYCFITGFSIGGAYTPAGWGLAVATIMAVVTRTIARVLRRVSTRRQGHA